MADSQVLSTPLPILEKMRDLIYAESGIIFTPIYMKVLDQRIISVCRESGSSPYDILDYVQNDIEYLREFVGHVTTNHTHFFRSIGQYRTLIDVMLPKLIQANGLTKKISIWSAASSSGEEAYTCIMMIKEYFQKNGYNDWICRIFASDIDNSSLRNGEKGVYGIEALKHIPEVYHKYLEIKHNIIDNKFDTGTVTVDKSLRQWVQFQYHNLMGEPPAASFDIIFCRNVLIYFDIPTQKEVVRKLVKTLKPNGYFFVSPSETLNGISDELEVQMTPVSIYYIKKS